MDKARVGRWPEGDTELGIVRSLVTVVTSGFARSTHHAVTAMSTATVRAANVTWCVVISQRPYS